MKKKKVHTDVKEAREFAREIDLERETEFDEVMKNTKNARKLKRIAKEKGKKAIKSNDYCSSQNDYCLEVKTVTWPIPTSKPKN